MRRIALILASLLSLGTAAQAESPVVVELYTSQGCSSCPPADAILADLAGRDDVIALALHVDYWDYIGWADTFAQPGFTARQQQYARAAGRRMVYTPQMIVGGGDVIIGSHAMELADLLMRHRDLEYPVHVELNRDEGVIRLSAVASMAEPEHGYIVQLVRYAPSNTVRIARGELAGHTLEYHNIVTDWQVIEAGWTGEAPFEHVLDSLPEGPLVAIVQRAGPGQIMGAARLLP